MTLVEINVIQNPRSIYIGYIREVHYRYLSTCSALCEKRKYNHMTENCVDLEKPCDSNM